MYLNTLIKIKNAYHRKFDRVKVPYGSLDLAILETLLKCGYVESVAKKGRGVKRIIEAKLKYDKDGKAAMSGLKFVSRPSRRIYVGYKDIKKSHDGYGYFIFSTPKGILTNVDARKNKVGGEILFEIW